MRTGDCVQGAVRLTDRLSGGVAFPLKGNLRLIAEGGTGM